MELKERIETEQTAIDDPKNQSLLTLISLKNSQQRSPIEIQFMKECLKHNQFFQFIHNYAKKKSTLDTIYRKLNVRELNPTELLFKHGDPSTEFHVILHGSVLVMLPRQMDKQVPTQYYFLNAEATKKIHTIHEDYVIVNRIQKGETFGEVGLIHKIPRTATIVAPPRVHEELTSCVLASFDYDSFINLVQPLLALKMKHKIEILKQVPDFENLSKRQVSIFCSACMETCYRMGQVIFEENSPGSFFYILVSGVIEFYKRLNGKQIGLYQTQHAQIFGQLLDQNQNHYMGAKAISDFVHLYKINRSVLVSQMERWGQEMKQQMNKKAWVNELFEKQIELTEKQTKEMEKKEQGCKSEVKRVLKIKSPLNRNSELHISSKKNKEQKKSEESKNESESHSNKYINQKQNYFLRYQPIKKHFQGVDKNKELEDKKEILYERLKQFSQPFIKVNNTQQSSQKINTQNTQQKMYTSQRMDQTQQSQLGKSLYDKISYIFGSESEYNLNKSTKDVQLVKARVQSAIKSKIKQNKNNSFKQSQTIEQLVLNQQKKLQTAPAPERKPYKGRPRSHLQAIFS